MRTILSRTIAASVAVALLLAAPAARAQDVKALNGAVEQYNGGNYSQAALGFFDIAENAGEPELVYRAEYYLALSLFKQGLFHSALSYDKAIIDQGPNHPYYQKAVENTLDVMDALGDKSIIPNLLDQQYSDAFAKLPKQVIDRINFVVALWGHQQRKFEEAADFLKAVPKDSPVYPRAIYLLGVQSAQKAKNGDDKQNDKAADLFGQVLKLQSSDKVKYADLDDLKQLATVALARVKYAQGKFGESYDLYTTLPRFSRYWRDSLFEGAYAAFMNDEYGKSLGQLLTLHAPMASDQLVPESWLLKAHLYYFACLFEESKSATAYLDKVYKPLQEQVKALYDAKKAPEFYYALLTEGQKDGVVMPPMARNDLLVDEGLRSRRAYILELQHEAEKIKDIDAWKKSLLATSLIESVDQQRNLLISVVGKGVQYGLGRISNLLEDIDGQADILKFEMAKREKDLLEAGYDQEGVLKKQQLNRPAMAKKGVEYWDFDGEFWPDELGFYRYTVKNACPPEEAAKE